MGSRSVLVAIVTFTSLVVACAQETTSTPIIVGTITYEPTPTAIILSSPTYQATPTPISLSTATRTPTATAIAATRPPPEPTATPTATPPPTLTAIPTATIQVIVEEPGLALDSLTVSRGLLGDPTFIGTVKNESTGTFPAVSVTFRFTDQVERRLVGTRSASILLTGEVGPGERVPFVTGLPEPGPGVSWDTVEVTIALDPIAGFLGRKRVEGLGITELEWQVDGVSGVISNGTNEVLGGSEFFEGFEIGVIGYDQAGEVVVVGNNSVTEVLQPGWSTTFRISATYLWGRSEEAVRYEARVLVRLGL